MSVLLDTSILIHGESYLPRKFVFDEVQTCLLKREICNKQQLYHTFTNTINLLPLIKKYILKRWDQQIYSKLNEIHSLVGKTPCSYGHNRKEQVLLTRCRIGHGRLTHSYLLSNEERPVIPMFRIGMF